MHPSQQRFQNIYTLFVHSLLYPVAYIHPHHASPYLLPKAQQGRCQGCPCEQGSRCRSCLERHLGCNRLGRKAFYFDQARPGKVQCRAGPDQQGDQRAEGQAGRFVTAAKTGGADRQDAIKSRIALSQAPGGNDRRSQIKAEMDSLRGEQGNNKSARQKTFDEMKRLQEGVQKKIKDAQASRGKLGFKSVAEVDQRIE
jgi:hypothetical protein